MVTIGLLQYIAPILQFALGRAVVPRADARRRWIGFVLVWIALVLFTFEAVAHRRRQLRMAPSRRARSVGR